MKRPCPTFVQIWQSEHPDNIFVMSANAGQTMGLGMDIENVDYRNLAPTYLPFHPLVELGLDKFIDAVNKLYVELNSHCPLKLWKDRLVAVWGQEHYNVMIAIGKPGMEYADAIRVNQSLNHQSQLLFGYGKQRHQSPHLPSNSG